MVHVEEKQHGIEILALSLACCSKKFAKPETMAEVVINRKTRRPLMSLSQRVVHSLSVENLYSQISNFFAYSLRFGSSLSPFS